MNTCSRRAFGALAIVALAGALASGASAREKASDRHSAGTAAGQFDYYLLSLSWSPTYCLTHRDDAAECGNKGYGFVLHGLWPQFEGGGYPQHCRTPARLDAAAERAGRMVYVSERLMRHEWQVHGSCSGLGAADYFRTADRALASVKIPAAFEAPRRSRHSSVEELDQAFRAANPQLPEGALRVACSRGELAEVRLCLGRDLAPRRCPASVRSSCGQRDFEVPAVR